MSTNKKIFTGDIGVVFRVYAEIDISQATSIIMKVKKPSGSTANWTSSLASDNNYYAVFSTISTSLDEAGDWLLSLSVVLPTGASFTGESSIFSVFKQFEDLP